jgi:hypothetical protein
MKKALSLTALSALLKQSNGVNSTQLMLAKRVKEKAQSKRYKSADYMSRVSRNFNINPSEKRAVQKIKKTLKNYPDIKQLTHEFHFGMPLENKQVYRAKREKLLRDLGTAKMLRASHQLQKSTLTQAKRTKIKNRQSRHYGTKR